MGSIYLRGTTWWGKWSEGGAIVRKSLGTRDRAEAQELLAKYETKAPTPTSSGVITVEQLCEEWFRQKAIVHASKPGTVDNYKCQKRKFIRLWGELPADDFPLDVLEKHLENEQGRNLKPETINHELILFRSILRWGLKKGKITSVPKPQLARVVKRRVPKAVSTEQRQALLAAVAGTPLEPVFRLALWCGLRQMEIITLRWDIDLDLERYTVHVQPRKGWSPKNHEARSIPLGLEARKWFSDYRGAARRGDPVCTHLNQPWVRRTLSDQTAKIFDELEIFCEQHHRLHMLRNSFAFAVLDQGADIETLRDLLGHGDIATTALYVQATSKSKQRAVEGLTLE